MKDFIKKNLATLIVAGAGLLALIFCLFLPGASYKTNEMGTKVTMNISTIGLMFGRSVLVTKAEGVKATIIYHGGLSIFGLFAFLCFVAGIGLVIASLFVKDKKLDFIGYILLVVAGIFLFLLLTVGTDINAVSMAGEKEKLTSDNSFSDAFELFKLGAGVYISGILAILAGGFGIANKYLKIIKK